VGVDEGLARLSDSLLLVAVLCYAVAMLGHFAEIVFSRPRVVPPIGGGAVDTMPRLSRAGQVALGAGGWPERVGRIAVGVTAAGWAVHLASAVTRGLSVGRVPWGNMYEFSSVVGLAAVSGWLWLLRTHDVRRLGAAVLLPVILLLGLAAVVLYAPARPLIPALQSYWITIHVTAAMLASGMFLVGFVLHAVFLVRPRDAFEEVASKVISLGFLVWTFAVIAGAIWAEAAWGRYWGWDPKETWAFITWVFYACYLHARVTRGWRGRRAAGIGVVGFAALMFCYYGVNLWISGLHSYAGT
jgi:ABC-type transport system involved in cytochrome c biogenesis permease subunit